LLIALRHNILAHDTLRIVDEHGWLEIAGVEGTGVTQL